MQNIPRLMRHGYWGHHPLQKETNASSVNYNDLEMAFDFSSDSNIYDSYAYVCRKSGKIYYVSDGIDDEEDL